MGIAFSRLLRELPNLTDEQLQQVKVRATILLQTGSATNKTKTSPAAESGTPDWLLEGILYELRRRGVGAIQLRDKIASIVPSYPSDSQLIRQHLLQCAGKPLRPAQQMSLGRTVARVLADWLHTAHIPVRLKPMLQQVPRIPEVLDDAFPDYQQSALLSFLVHDG